MSGLGPPLYEHEFVEARKGLYEGELPRFEPGDFTVTECAVNVSKSTSSKLKNFHSAVTTRWPNARLPYTIAADFTAGERLKIAVAIANIVDNTCVQIRPREATDIDYVHIFKGGRGCYASDRYVASRGSQHDLHLEAPGCLVRNKNCYIFFFKLDCLTIRQST